MNNCLEHGNCDVAIIGAGPAGLAAATYLKKEGVEKVLVLDRESEAGGIPRHCGHPPFGIVEYNRLMTGPRYAKRLVETALSAEVEFALKTSVTLLEPEGVLKVATPDGVGRLKARRVLLATGVRETPRSARLVSGGRMNGIGTTGALQSMFYLKNKIPFSKPVVVGTETVSFSALLTCRKAGIKPVAMLEENQRPTVPWPLQYAAALIGVPLITGTRITNINGTNRVESVEILDKRNKLREINCDGVLFTGQFTPESSLLRMSHLLLDYDTGSPVIDVYGRCSDRVYYAAGNLLQPLNMSLNCWREGRRTAKVIAKDLTGKLPAPP